jgi:hypothetical protein
MFDATGLIWLGGAAAETPPAARLRDPQAIQLLYSNGRHATYNHWQGSRHALGRHDQLCSDWRANVEKATPWISGRSPSWPGGSPSG